jgi:hypothetical protein
MKTLSKFVKLLLLAAMLLICLSGNAFSIPVTVYEGYAGPGVMIYEHSLIGAWNDHSMDSSSPSSWKTVNMPAIEFVFDTPVYFVDAKVKTTGADNQMNGSAPAMWAFDIAGNYLGWSDITGILGNGAWPSVLSLDMSADLVFTAAHPSISRVFIRDYDIDSSIEISQITYNVAHAPEPSTFLLLGAGLVGFVILWKRKLLLKSDSSV